MATSRRTGSIILTLSQEEGDFMYTMLGKMNGKNPGWEIFMALGEAGADYSEPYHSMPHIDLVAVEKGGK